VQNATVRDYTKGCNTVQNIDKDVSLRDQVILVRGNETIREKVPLLVRSLKHVIILVFIPDNFSFFIFPASISDFSLLLVLHTHDKDTMLDQQLRPHGLMWLGNKQ